MARYAITLGSAMMLSAAAALHQHRTAYQRPSVISRNIQSLRRNVTAAGTGSPAISLPADHYMHRGAPTEWWWHVGTLRDTASDSVFGFEINAASLGSFAMTQVMLTDVAKQVHYSRTARHVPPVDFDPATWAEHDVTRDWHVELGSEGNALSGIEVVSGGDGFSADGDDLEIIIVGGGGSLGDAVPIIENGTVIAVKLLNPGRGYKSPPTVELRGGGGRGAVLRAVHSYVSMDAAWGDPTQRMAIRAYMEDEHTHTPVTFDLTVTRTGLPFLVWGTGVFAFPLHGGTHLEDNNYYYSLTRLTTEGSITVNSEKFIVTGTTWMDHEYGAFGSGGKPVKWSLQDFQLCNGWTIMNDVILGGDSGVDQGSPTWPSFATLQAPNGTLYTAESTIVSSPHTWTSPRSQITYYMEMTVKIPAFGAKLMVRSLMEDQEFDGAVTVNGVVQGSLYEGVAHASGVFEGVVVKGSAWIEQQLS